MRRALAPVLIGFGAFVLAAPVCAQSQPTTSSQSGLRRLDWAGKAEPRPAEPGVRADAAARARAQAAASRPTAPNRYSSRVAPAEPSRVWNPFPDDPAPPPALRPARPAVQVSPAVQAQPAPQVVAPSYAAQLRPAAPPAVSTPPPPQPPRAVQNAPAQLQTAPARPAPQRPAPAQPVAAPVQAATREVPAEAPPRAYADFSRPVTSTPAAPTMAAPAPVVPAAPAAAAGDATPPRSYADFSRPMTANPAAPPRGEAPRYYSVHREYGRQPEQPAIPEAFFIDSVGGEDLAAPPEPLMSERDERRARAAAADPDASQP